MLVAPAPSKSAESDWRPCFSRSCSTTSCRDAGVLRIVPFRSVGTVAGPFDPPASLRPDRAPGEGLVWFSPAALSLPREQPEPASIAMTSTKPIDPRPGIDTPHLSIRDHLYLKCSD